MRYLPLALFLTLSACPKKNAVVEAPDVTIESADVEVVSRPDVPDDGYPRRKRVDLNALADRLPKDENGNAILLDKGDHKVTLRPDREEPSPSTAFGACGSLVTGCLAKTKDLDDCVTRVPRCQTETPWLESPCCPSACADFYLEERRLGAELIAASNATFGSDHECFPGLQDWYRKAGGTPDLAPRRQPLPSDSK